MDVMAIDYRKIIAHVLYKMVQRERRKLIKATQRLSDLCEKRFDEYRDGVAELRPLIELLASAVKGKTEGDIWDPSHCAQWVTETQLKKYIEQVTRIEEKLKDGLHSGYRRWHAQEKRYFWCLERYRNTVFKIYGGDSKSVQKEESGLQALEGDFWTRETKLVASWFEDMLWSLTYRGADFAKVEDAHDCTPIEPLYPTAAAIEAVLGQPPEPKSVSPDQVFFSAIAPRRFPEGEKTDLAVVMYEDEYSGILEQIKENYDSKVMIQGTGAKSVVKGTNIRVVIQSSDERVVVDSSEQEAVWIGKYLEFHFWVMVPEGFRKKQIELSVHIYTDQIRFSTLRFCVKCESDSLQQITPDRRDVRTAFVSYAREDAKAVSLLMQGIEKVRPDLELFMDLEKLRSGQNWREVLKREIEQRDILYLCWSAKARVSEWVDFEWRHMYRKRGIDYIDPIPLESPKICPPPTELSNLHFDERWIYYRNSNDPICCIRSNDDGTIIPFAKEQILVGREASADVVLRNNKISRKHLLITLLEKNQFLVQDLNSLNGSVVDGSGEKITFEGVIVPPGTKIRLAEDTVIEIL